MDTAETLLHDLPKATIRRISVSEMDNNVYLLTSKETGSQILIDAADDAGAIRGLVASAAGDAPGGTQLAVVVTTHRHWDHVRALPELAAGPGVGTAAGADDAEAIRADTGVRIDRELRDGDAVAVPGLELEAIHLRGHTPGSIALVYRDPAGPAHVFSGDSLFPGGVGNTQGDPERFESLYTDVVGRVFERFADDTLVHPGHGQGTTLGAERPHLPEWRERGW